MADARSALLEVQGQHTISETEGKTWDECTDEERAERIAWMKAAVPYLRALVAEMEKVLEEPTRP